MLNEMCLFNGRIGLFAEWLLGAKRASEPKQRLPHIRAATFKKGE
jgi:hypothetical protein